MGTHSDQSLLGEKVSLGNLSEFHLTLCILMASSFWFDTIHLGQSIIYYLRESGYNFNKILFLFFLSEDLKVDFLCFSH